MIFRTCRVVGTQLEATYKLWMTGGGFVYWAQHKLRVQCPDFGAYLVAGLLEVHWQTQHGVDKGVEGEEKWDTPPPPTLSRYPQMYRMSFLSVGVLKNFPAEGCRGGGGATSTCGDQIGGLFCPPGRARACVKPCSPELPTLLGAGRPSFV